MRVAPMDSQHTSIKSSKRDAEENVRCPSRSHDFGMPSLHNLLTSTGLRTLNQSGVLNVSDSLQLFLDAKARRIQMSPWGSHVKGTPFHRLYGDQPLFCQCKSGYRRLHLTKVSLVKV